VHDLSSDPDLSIIGSFSSDEDLHQRRLSGAVFPEERENRACGGIKVHAMQDLDTAE
jgi:hypothetical protein